MKLQIDTDSKVLRIEGVVPLKELIEKLNQLFPNGSWMEYSLGVVEVIPWTTPIIIQQEPSPKPYPWTQPNPWSNPPITYCTDSSSTKSAVYNVEC